MCETNLSYYNGFVVPKEPYCVNRLQYICGVKSLWQVGIGRKHLKKSWMEGDNELKNRFRNTALDSTLHW